MPWAPLSPWPHDCVLLACGDTTKLWIALEDTLALLWLQSEGQIISQGKSLCLRGTEDIESFKASGV